MILVYHKFFVDVHNLQDFKRKSGFRSSDTSLFFYSIVFQANFLFTIPGHMVLK
jgi:hypothetical protein